MSAPRDPQTRTEWQEAVDCAEGLLALDSARQYGLIAGGPEVNVDRCLEILRAGFERGIKPSEDAVEHVARGLA
jgi:hypothetical protein